MLRACPAREINGAFGVDGVSKNGIGVMSEFGHTIEQHSRCQYCTGVGRVNDPLRRPVKMLEAYVNGLSCKLDFEY